MVSHDVARMATSMSDDGVLVARRRSCRRRIGLLRATTTPGSGESSPSWCSSPTSVRAPAPGQRAGGPLGTGNESPRRRVRELR